MCGCGRVVEALVKEGSGFLSGCSVVMEVEVVEGEDGGGWRGESAAIGIVNSRSFPFTAFRVRMTSSKSSEEWAGWWWSELFELANAGIGALPDCERFVVRGQMRTKGFDEDGADVVL